MTLTELQISFLKEEFNINDINNLSEAETDKLYEDLADIEVEEYFDKDVSRRGSIAVGIMNCIADEWID